MARIQKLSRHLVNQIAAGEVIERPASVVKELVENAIDAGATRIEITVEDGGKQRISVSDDGAGMDADDVKLAFAPHATSKLDGKEDLFRIGTLGFRGEALASIASISHARIRTRRKDDPAGWEVTASGEQINDPTPAAAPPGTTIDIRNLFFNTPARRKFLRTTNTEFGHVTEQVSRLALPHPQIAFTLRHNGRDSLTLAPCESTAQRIAELFTPDLGDNLLPLVARDGAVSVRGLIGRPAVARSNSNWQYVFLNGRFIRDRMIAAAIREAYRGLLPGGRYPAVFLFLQVDPGEVDVNVHPTKVEVRFRQNNQVYGEVLAAMKETLNRADLSPSADLDAADRDNDPAPGDQARNASLREALADFFKSAPPPPSRLSFPDAQRPAPSSSSRPPSSAPYTPRPAEGSLVPPPAPATPDQPDSPAAPAGSPGEPQQHTPAPPIVQLHNSYIVTQDEKGVVIIDQHALHERILYNRYRRRLTEGGLTSQRMLIPASLTLSAGEAALLEEAGDMLGTLGIVVESFGPDSVAVQQFPTVLAERGVDCEAFLRDVLDQLARDDLADREVLIEKVLAVMACKAAVKAGDPLDEREMRNLLADGRQAEKASSCPHGRPTTIRLTLGELEKQFKRT